MRVFVAGATGAIGVPAVRQLLARGHEVVGLTRSEEKGGTLEELGARPVLSDVFDAQRMKEVMADARPEGVLQLLNALPKRGPVRIGELKETSRLRVEGTENVLAAAISAGARRYVAESMVFGYGYRAGRAVTEEDAFGVETGIAELDDGLRALADLERQVLGATASGAIEGIVLRFGLFYGPGVGSTEFMIRLLRRRMMRLPGGGRGIGSWIHVEDAASAIVTALEHARPGSVYNVVDDEPVTMMALLTEMARVLDLPGPRSIPRWMARFGGRYAGMIASAKLAVSNSKIKDELGWLPDYPTYREGVPTLA